MVERIKITPSQIVIKDSSNNIQFNTDNLYLKTGGGTLFAGGYARSPAIYGQNTISDKPNDGWYTASMYSAESFPRSANNTFWWRVPKSDTTQFRFLPTWTLIGGLVFSSGQARPLIMLESSTNFWFNTSITLVWKVGYFGLYNGAVDGYGNPTYESPTWMMWPEFSNYTFPNPTSPGGGIFRVDWSANEHLNYYRVVTDGYGNVSSIPFWSSYPDANVFWRPNAVFSKRAPVALSLAVTP